MNDNTFEHINPRVDKIIYPFIRSDGYLSPCVKGCPNCKHCSDVIWSYTTGIYHCICKIDNENEVCCPDYENDGTKPVTIDEFVKMKNERNGA